MTVLVLAFYPHGEQQNMSDFKLIRTRKLNLRVLQITKTESGGINMESEDLNSRLLDLLKRETTRLMRATGPQRQIIWQSSQDDSAPVESSEEDSPSYTVKYFP